MRKPMNADNSNVAGSQGLQLASRALTYLTLGSLLCACIILSILLKGARQAHHEIWEELLEQETKTANAYQDVAADKVIVVEAEEKANVALRDLSFCKQDLQWSKQEVEGLTKKVTGLEVERDGLIEQEAACKQEKETLSKELEVCEDSAHKAVGMIDTALDGERIDVQDGTIRAPKSRRRQRRSPAIHAVDFIGDQQNDRHVEEKLVANDDDQL